MKIILEKNLAFSDQEKPILSSEVSVKVKGRKAIKLLPAAKVDLNLNLPVEGAPKIEVVQDRNKKMVLRIANFKVGQHISPSNIEAKEIPTLGPKSATFSKALVTESYLPDHLDLQPVVSPLSSEFQTPPFFRGFRDEKDKKIGNQATTVFPPDNRMIFRDTSYPWSTFGRVDSPLGQGSGVMVGPRHLLTVSHVIQWNGDGSAGWVRFRPAYFAPSAPFGDAWAIRTYFKKKVVGPTVDWIEGMYDYVCCVLDRNIGNWTGWLGAKGYTDSWDGGSYWSHVGYPGDLTGGNKPTFQNGISLDGVWWELDSHEAMSHRADVWPGQSGGPFFGWWSGKPYAVATQSSQTSDQNNASGGQDMVDLILKARADYP
jgi:V8-like Glu-specific endopeptidase